MVNLNKVQLSIILMVLISLVSNSTIAIKVNSLYSTKIPVSTQSAQERINSAPLGIGEVLIKVSGDTQILNNPKIKSRLTTSDSLIEEFSYNNTTNGKQPYLLELHFDNKAVNQWLRDASAPIWGQTRPLILTLATLTTPEHPIQIINNNPANKITQLLIDNAERRGLPITLPLMDITDTSQITIENIIQQRWTKLNTSTQRYGSEALLLGNIEQNTNSITSHWKLILGSEQWEWNLAGNTDTEIIASLVDKVTNTLAARYAIVTTNKTQNTLTITVTGISQQFDVMQLVRYLNHLTPVVDVSITNIANDAITFRINLRSTQQAFMQAIALEKELTPTPNPKDTTSSLTYQWSHS
jgi:hypothetical protein